MHLRTGWAATVANNFRVVARAFAIRAAIFAALISRTTTAGVGACLLFVSHFCSPLGIKVQDAHSISRMKQSL
jgi:hypothetical protein